MSKNPQCVLAPDKNWLYYLCTVKSTKTGSANIAEAKFTPPGAILCDSLDQIEMRIGGAEATQFAVREIKISPPDLPGKGWMYDFTILERGDPEVFTSCDVQCRFAFKKTAKP